MLNVYVAFVLFCGPGPSDWFRLYFNEDPGAAIATAAWAVNHLALSDREVRLEDDCKHTVTLEERPEVTPWER